MINLRTGIKKFDSASVDLSYRVAKEGANGWEPNHRTSTFCMNRIQKSSAILGMPLQVKSL